MPGRCERVYEGNLKVRTSTGAASWGASVTMKALAVLRRTRGLRQRSASAFWCTSGHTADSDPGRVALYLAAGKVRLNRLADQDMLLYQ